MSAFASLNGTGDARAVKRHVGKNTVRIARRVFAQAATFASGGVTFLLGIVRAVAAGLRAIFMARPKFRGGANPLCD
jgi:hypothetical protein